MLETTFIVSHPRDVKTYTKIKDFIMSSPQPTDNMYAGEART